LKGFRAGCAASFDLTAVEIAASAEGRLADPPEFEPPELAAPFNIARAHPVSISVATIRAVTTAARPIRDSAFIRTPVGCPLLATLGQLFEEPPLLVGAHVPPPADFVARSQAPDAEPMPVQHANLDAGGLGRCGRHSYL
jgi:hypothetical protein